MSKRSFLFLTSNSPVLKKATKTNTNQFHQTLKEWRVSFDWLPFLLPFFFNKIIIIIQIEIVEEKDVLYVRRPFGPSYGKT